MIPIKESLKVGRKSHIKKGLGIHGKCRGYHVLESKNFSSPKTNEDGNHKLKQLQMGKNIT